MKMYENKNAINEDDRTKVNRRASKKPRLKKEPKHTKCCLKVRNKILTLMDYISY